MGVQEEVVEAEMVQLGVPVGTGLGTMRSALLSGRDVLSGAGRSGQGNHGSGKRKRTSILYETW